MKYFDINEFACKCGCGQNEMRQEFLDKLDKAREMAGVPFSITSGYRCKKHNTEVGGVAQSAHTKGWAADILVTNDRARDSILSALMGAGFRRIGIAKTFIHVDCDPVLPQDVIWLYY